MHGDDLILLIILAITIGKDIKRKRVGPISNWLLILLFLQIVGLFSGMVTDHMNVTLKDALKTEFKSFRPLIYSLIISIGFVNRKDLEGFYFTLIATLVAAFALMALINMYPSLEIKDIWMRESQMRMYASLEEGTQRYAGVLAGVWNAGVVGEVLSVFAASAFFSSVKIKNYLLFYISPIIALMALTLSATRTGSLLVVLGVSIVFMMHFKRLPKLKKRYVYMTLAGIGLLYFRYNYLLPMLGSRLIARLGNMNSAFYDRKIIWITVLKDSFPDGLLFGVGSAGLKMPAHSLFVWIIAVLGGVGIVYFSAMNFAIFRGLSWMKKIESVMPISKKYNMRAAIIAMIPCILIHGLFDSIGYFAREIITIFCVVAYKWYNVNQIAYSQRKEKKYIQYILPQRIKRLADRFA